MDWIADNLVWLSVLVCLGAIVVGVAVAAIAGLRAYRAARAAADAAGAAAAALQEQVDRVTAATEALPRRGEEVQVEIARLQARVAALGVVAGAAGQAVSVLRAPFGENIT